MVSQRNRSIELVNFLESLGIDVNVGKNKARGNKGFFKAQKSIYRIDVAQKLTDAEIERVLVHEFAHFLHYTYDKTLKNLDFIFDNFNNEIEEELLALTVHIVPKDTAQNLFEAKNSLKQDIKNLSQEIKVVYPDFQASKPFLKIERKIGNQNCKLLLKYDKVKMLTWTGMKYYSIENLEKDFSGLEKVVANYIKLRSKYRYLNRINNKISKLNRYYSSYTEMFARSIEMFVYERNLMKTLAPKVCDCYKLALKEQKIQLLNDFFEIFI